MTRPCRICRGETKLHLRGFPLCFDCNQNLNFKGSTSQDKLTLLKDMAIRLASVEGK